MNIAELFVNLGIKGADATVGALGSVKKGLGDVSSMSLEAKAGILAALYGLQQLTAASGQAGTSLTNFANLTGIMPQTLQKWQYAARQAGESNEELAGSFKSLQGTMTNTLMGKGAPEGFAMVQKAVGLDPARLKDTVYVMEQLNKAAKAMPLEIGNTALKSFGMSDATIAAMRKGVFNQKNFDSAPTYSDGEVKSLDKSNIAWSNLGNKIEMAFGHLNAKHGLQMVQDISKLADAVFRLVEGLEKLSEKLKLFDALSQSFDGLAKITEMLSGKSVDEVMKGDHAKRHFGDGTWWMKAINSTEDAAIDFASSPHKIDSQFDALAKSMGQPAHTSHVVNQTITHHGDAKDTKAVKDLHSHAVGNAFRQRSAQRQGS